MSLRLRVLTPNELFHAHRDGYPKVIPLVHAPAAGENPDFRDDILECRYAVLEETYGDGSAEGMSWRPVEVYD